MCAYRKVTYFSDVKRLRLKALNAACRMQPERAKELQSLQETYICVHFFSQQRRQKEKAV